MLPLSTPPPAHWHARAYIAVNCWPNVSSSGCDVNIEYELQAEELELNDVVISIPVP